jgi:hypothetical protein
MKTTMSEEDVKLCTISINNHTYPNPQRITLLQLLKNYKEFPKPQYWSLAENIGLNLEKKHGIQRLAMWEMGNTLHSFEMRMELFTLLQQTTLDGYYPIQMIPLLNRIRADYNRSRRSQKDLMPGEWGYIGWAILNYVEDKGFARYTEMETFYQTHLRGFTEHTKGGSFIHHLHNLKKQDPKRRCKRYLHKSDNEGMWETLYL